MEISTEFLVLVPVVIGLVEVLKHIGLVSKFLPLASLILGVAGIGLLDAFTGANVLQGIIVGLTASGLFSGTKSTLS